MKPDECSNSPVTVRSLRFPPESDISEAMLTTKSEGWWVMFKDDVEHSIPEPWRTTFRQIANAFAAGDFELRCHTVERVAAVPPATAAQIAANVSAYGDALAPLNDATWEGSVFRWMDGYWQVLVDLTTAREPVSDLTLHAKLYEGNGSRLEIDSVHVP